MDAAAAKVIDPKLFWRALGERAIGLTIVTALGKDGPAGFLGLSATHVTASPPTMLVSIDRKTSALEAVLMSKTFAVNFLPGSAVEDADAFGYASPLKGADRFLAGRWSRLTTGAPVHVDALGAFDCRVADVITRGDISIVIGDVVDVTAKGAGDPLVFFRGKNTPIAGL